MDPTQALRELYALRPVFDRYWGRQTLPDRMEVIRSLIRDCGDSCDMLEVGCWIGYGTLTWRAAISELPNKGSVTCVDPWVPYQKEDEVKGHVVARVMHKALTTGEAFHAFLYVIQHGETSVPVTYHKKTLKEAYPDLGKYDLIFIDGSHYYHDVMSDIELARKLIKPGGTICGDDLEMQLCDMEEKDVRGDLGNEWVGRPDRKYHPGVTAAVWDSFGAVKNQNAVWWVR